MKVVDGNEFNVAKRTIASTKLSENDKVLSVLSAADIDHIVLQTHKGVFLKFAFEEIPEKKKGAIGVRGIRLSADDKVESVYLLNKNSETLITYNEKIMSLNKLKLAHRDGKGTKVRI